MEQQQRPVININSISFRNGASCGYCNGKKSSKLWVTSGFECPKITPIAYQELMDSGWRRCGIYYYMPHHYESCCQAFTIRLDTYNFRQRYSHQKVLRKIRHIEKADCSFRNSEELSSQSPQVSPGNNILQGIENQVRLPQELKHHLKELKVSVFNNDLQLRNVELPKLYDEVYRSVKEFSINFCQNLIKHVNQIIDTAGGVPDSNIEVVRNRVIEFFIQVQQTHRVYESKNCIIATNVAALFYSYLRDFWFNMFQIKLPVNQHPEMIELFKEIMEIQQHNSQLKATIKNGFQIMCTSDSINTYKAVKMAAFRVLLPKVSKRQKKKPEVLIPIPRIQASSPIVIKWVKAQFEYESFELYCRYQLHTHGKEVCSKESYQSFLCQSAIIEETHISDDGTELKCGCWHMKYYLDDTLIAVGVVDVLIRSVSSVYFFYDPAYRKYSLGVYGALQEIEFMNQKKKAYPLLQFYYLGFYIQDSQKMVYKGDYEHSELLCPLTKSWVSLDSDLRKRIDKIREAMINQQLLTTELKSLSQNAIVQHDTNEELDVFIKNYITLMAGPKEYKITELKQRYSKYMIEVFKQLVPLFGKELARSFVFKYHGN